MQSVQNPSSYFECLCLQQQQQLGYHKKLFPVSNCSYPVHEWALKSYSKVASPLLTTQALKPKLFSPYSQNHIKILGCHSKSVYNRKHTHTLKILNRIWDVRYYVRHYMQMITTESAISSSYTSSGQKVFRSHRIKVPESPCLLQYCLH